MELTVLLAWATLLVGFPLNVIATVFLYRHWRAAPHLRVLRERFIVSVVTTVVALVFGVIFVNNDREVPWLGLDATKLITRSVMLVMVIVPAAGWLVIYYRRNGRGKV